MASAEIFEATAALTAGGTALGLVTIGTTADFWPGARCWLASTTEVPIEVVIYKIVNGTTMQCFIPKTGPGGKEIPTYLFGSDLSAYHVGDAATIYQPKQVVPTTHAGAKLTQLW